MNLQRALGFSLIAAAISLVMPALLSAQGEVANPEQPVTITLLGDGKIRVSGNVVLEMPDSAAQITATRIAIDQTGTRVMDFSEGMTVEVLDYVVESESGAILVEEGQVRQLRMLDAVISPAQ